MSGRGSPLGLGVAGRVFKEPLENVAKSLVLLRTYLTLEGIPSLV